MQVVLLIIISQMERLMQSRQSAKCQQKTGDKPLRKGISPVQVDISSGQYDFVSPDGKWEEDWITETPGEWWQKQLWLKAGRYESYSEKST